MIDQKYTELRVKPSNAHDVLLAHRQGSRNGTCLGRRIAPPMLRYNSAAACRVASCHTHDSREWRRQNAEIVRSRVIVYSSPRGAIELGS